MGKLRRRSSFRQPGKLQGGLAPAGRPPEAVIVDRGASRRAFLQSTAGAVGGAAMILATPKVASLALEGSGPGAAGEPQAVDTEPSGPGPREPVPAYVRDAERGEVTVMSGTFEATYRDPMLVKRLLDAAR